MSQIGSCRLLVFIIVFASCSSLALRAPTALAPDATRSLMRVGYYVHHIDSSWSTVLAQGHSLNWVITTSYGLVDTAGTLSGTHDSEVMQLARSRGSEVHFRVANYINASWSRRIAHTVLTRPTARARATAAILSVLDSYDYDGVHIDLENVPPADRGALTSFMAQLYPAIRSRGKTLSIAVPAKVDDRLGSDWSGAFDYEALGRASDWLIVMAYDQHWSTSTPGPVASLPWVEAVTQYAVRKVSAQKVLLGVALYGYHWPKRGAAEAISMRQAAARASRVRAEIRWNEQAQAPYYKVFGQTVHFEDARSIDRKLGLAVRYGLAGVAMWRLGFELPEVWDVVNAYLATPLPLLSSPP